MDTPIPVGIRDRRRSLSRKTQDVLKGGSFSALEARRKAWVQGPGFRGSRFRV